MADIPVVRPRPADASAACVYRGFRDLDPEAAVITLYVEIFGRYPDASGLATYLEHLAQGRPLVELAEGLLASEEAASRTPVQQASAAAFVDHLRLHSLSEASVCDHARDQRLADARTIIGSGMMDEDYWRYLGKLQGARHERDRGVGDLEQRLIWYLTLSSAVAPRALARPYEVRFSRPAAGFNPLSYAEQNDRYVEARDGDPLADFIRRNKPPGPWVREVITPRAGPPTKASARILVHGHYYYPDEVAKLLDRLDRVESEFDLVLTTATAGSGRALASALARHGVQRYSIEIYPNRGRDLGPLLTGIASRVLDYDLLLHVHGKKTPHAEEGIADEWNTILFESLVGGRAPMFDTIANAFADDPKLGLVSASDPYLNDWNENKAVAKQIAPRLGLTGSLANQFDFPVGTMFWARTAALKPFLNADFRWTDYPDEPLPIDGTMLHALERLVPFVVDREGYSYKFAFVPGLLS